MSDDSQSNVPTNIYRSVSQVLSSPVRLDRFAPGTMLAGRFRVVALLGKGGMGEVYRAEDTRLGHQSR